VIITLIPGEGHGAGSRSQGRAWLQAGARVQKTGRFILYLYFIFIGRFILYLYFIFIGRFILYLYFIFIGRFICGGRFQSVSLSPK
jgi:hypothetical protein